MGLSISRRPRETVMIGNVRIGILNICGQKVRLLIDAPPEMEISDGEPLQDRPRGPVYDGRTLNRYNPDREQIP